MAHEARTATLTRRNWLLAGLGIAVSAVKGATSPLTITWDGDDIHVAAPQLHFLSGKSLERLKNGAAVSFLSQLTLSTDANATVYRRRPERFVVSYDLWEERFSVVSL